MKKNHHQERGERGKGSDSHLFPAGQICEAFRKVNVTSLSFCGLPSIVYPEGKVEYATAKHRKPVQARLELAGFMKSLRLRYTA
jgi:hypothetical protein